ncbi:IclR family transcriptional regulator [Streptomyces massasporeus]|uniref:IclR family transcriptional regulator n=1 Tax=Streptomyces massasporeus TaxID=67324 RepID=UPI0036549AD9
MQLVKRALSVLRAVADAEEGIALKDLVRQLDIPLSSMHRLVAVLEENRCLSRSPSNRRYFLGPAAVRFADEDHLRRALTRPHQALEELRRRTGGTVYVTELLGGHTVCTTLLKGVRPTGLFAEFGQRMPLHADPSARVLLAHLSEPVARRMLMQQPLISFTKGTPRTVDAVMERVRRIREGGYDTAESELDQGVFVVAAPIRLSTGRVRAAVALAAPTVTATSDQDRRDLVTAVLASVAEMSSDLGYVQRAA